MPSAGHHQGHPSARGRPVSLERLGAGPESLDDGDRSGDTAGFDDDVVGKWIPPQEFDHLTQQIIANRAADAAIGEAHRLAFDGHDQFGVNVDFAEVVYQDGDPAWLTNWPEYASPAGFSPIRETRRL